MRLDSGGGPALDRRPFHVAEPGGDDQMARRPDLTVVHNMYGSGNVFRSRAALQNPPRSRREGVDALLVIVSDGEEDDRRTVAILMELFTERDGVVHPPVEQDHVGVGGANGARQWRLIGDRRESQRAVVRENAPQSFAGNTIIAHDRNGDRHVWMRETRR